MAGIRKNKQIKNLKRRRTKDGRQKITLDKSYQDSSKSFVSPDYSDKATWYFQAVEVIDEIATTSDNTVYDFGTAAGSKEIINLDKITDRSSWTQKGITVKNNDVVITSGFTVSTSSKTITFDSANSGSDVIKVSYSYENGSVFDLTATTGKKVLLSYVETQFSVGTVFPSDGYMIFELILNTPATGNTDVVLGGMQYKTAKDFLNKGNHGTVLEPFGELTKKINIFPWNYMTGFTIKPVGDTTTDPTKNEFNKIRMRMNNDIAYTNCEIASGTFYCEIEDL